MTRIPRRKFLEMGVASAALAGCATPPRGPLPPNAYLQGQIQHFVVLMMENRSYDQMLGGLPGAQYAGPPKDTALAYTDSAGKRLSVPLTHGVPPDSFYPDPPHRFAKVAKQIYGGGPSAPADMGGFAQVFANEHAIVSPLAASVADYATHYADGRLPILQTLAKEYGVCTHWFSSLPGPTTPNRMFTHAGTSGGTTSQGAFYSRLRRKMIFDVLGNDQAAWRVYYHDVPHLWLTGDIWTKAFAGHQRRIGRFARDVANDELPVYTFIEPRHVLPPWNSQHPFMGVSHGEELIARVYNELISNPRVFEKTLLLIVYDEHGGFYDHVVPPGHDGWDAGLYGIEHRVIAPSRPSDDGFDFTRLGPRVPAVVVSPWIERGSVFGWNAPEPEDRRTFDHTSILATVGTMTGKWVESPRARAATPLDVTINRAVPRTDASKLTYRSASYHRPATSQAIQRVATHEPAGVAREICDRWNEEHNRDASPEQIVAAYEALVQ
jgi:phospholipase C